MHVSDIFAVAVDVLSLRLALVKLLHALFRNLLERSLSAIVKCHLVAAFVEFCPLLQM